MQKVVPPGSGVCLEILLQMAHDPVTKIDRRSSKKIAGGIARKSPEKFRYKSLQPLPQFSLSI